MSTLQTWAKKHVLGFGCPDGFWFPSARVSEVLLDMKDSPGFSFVAPFDKSPESPSNLEVTEKGSPNHRGG